MKQLWLFGAAIALSACATGSRAGPPIRTDGVAAFGETSRVGRLTITPQALVEDSRCPINARCVWAGRLVLKTRIEGAGWRETIDLTLGQSAAIHGGRIMLVAAKPDKLAGTATRPGDYRFGFERISAPQSTR
jgi:hypothetical protein